MRLIVLCLSLLVCSFGGVFASSDERASADGNFTGLWRMKVQAAIPDPAARGFHFSLLAYPGSDNYVPGYIHFFPFTVNDLLGRFVELQEKLSFESFELEPCSSPIYSWEGRLFWLIPVNPMNSVKEKGSRFLMMKPEADGMPETSVDGVCICLILGDAYDGPLAASKLYPTSHGVEFYDEFKSRLFGKVGVVSSGGASAAAAEEEEKE